MSNCQCHCSLIFSPLNTNIIIHDHPMILRIPKLNTAQHLLNTFDPGMDRRGGSSCFGRNFFFFYLLRFGQQPSHWVFTVSGFWAAGGKRLGKNLTLVNVRSDAMAMKHADNFHCREFTPLKPGSFGCRVLKRLAGTGIVIGKSWDFRVLGHRIFWGEKEEVIVWWKHGSLRRSECWFDVWL